MEHIVSIAGVEYPAKVRLRSVDPENGCRRTATVVMEGTVDEIKALFDDPGQWQAVRKDDDGNVVKVTDCSEYERLLVVKDHLDGTVSAVLCAVTAEEILQVLTGGGA